VFGLVGGGLKTPKVSREEFGGESPSSADWKVWEYTSCRFVQQEQWERWRDKRKLVSGSKHRGRFCGGLAISPPEKV